MGTIWDLSWKCVWSNYFRLYGWQTGIFIKVTLNILRLRTCVLSLSLLNTPSSFAVWPRDTREGTSARRTDVRRRRLYFLLLFDPRGRPPPALCRSFLHKEIRTTAVILFWFVHSLRWRPPFASPKHVTPSILFYFFRARLNCWLRPEAFSVRDLMTAVGFFCVSDGIIWDHAWWWFVQFM